MKYAIQVTNKFKSPRTGEMVSMQSYFQYNFGGVANCLTMDESLRKEYAMKSDAQLDFQKYFRGSKKAKIVKI